MNTERIKKVSIVVPVYNEEQSLPTLIDLISAVGQDLNCEYELLLIDDGSRDRSPDMIKAAAARPENNIVGIILNRNYGQHSAIMAGFKHCTGDLIITLDADLQNPPEEIPKLIAAANEGYDVVGTIRKNRQDTWFRRQASKLINTIIQRVAGKNMGDYGCMLRAYRRPIIDAILNCSESSSFIPVLAITFARNSIEIPVNHAERKYGESKYSFLQLINLMFDLLTSLTTAPLRLLSIVGSITACFGIFFALLLVILRLFLGSSWGEDGVFMLFAILFIFVGGQFLGMGLLGEYIGRIYQDVRARPRYIIQQIVSKNNATDVKDQNK